MYILQCWFKAIDNECVKMASLTDEEEEDDDEDDTGAFSDIISPEVIKKSFKIYL